MSLSPRKNNVEMTQNTKKSVSEIVEKYVTAYPKTERKALKKLILQKYREINPRTLDRHLAKVFMNEKRKLKPSNKELSILFEDLLKAKESLFRGDKRAANKTIMFLLHVLPLEQQTAKLKHIIAENNRLLKNSPNFNFETIMLTDRFIEELWQIFVKP